MKTLLYSASVLALTSTIATAEGSFTGDLTFGYSFGDLSSGGFSQDADTMSLRMHSTVTLADNLEFDLNLGTRSTDISGTPLEFDSTYIAVIPRYTFDNGLIFGAYYETVDNGLNLLPIDLGGSSYGLSLGKNFGNWEIEGFIGASENDLLDALPVNVDLMDFGLRGGWNVNDKFHLGGHFIYSEIDAPNPVGSLGIYSLGVGGQYIFNDQWAAYGGLSRQWLDETVGGVLPIDVAGTRYSIGVSYTYAGAGLPIVASLELARTDLDLDQPVNGSGDFNEVRLGLTIPLGHKGRSTPLNSSYREITGGGHSALSHLLGLY